MFAPPAEITAEVFTRLPDSMRKDPKESCWVRVQHRGHGPGCFLEGSSFDREGNLYVTDIAYGRVFKVTPDGSFNLVAEYDGEPNGLKLHKDGRVFIADYRNGIMVLDPASGAVAPVVDRPYLERFYGVNDLFFAANGDLYFTDQGQSGLHEPRGRLFRLSADGRLEVLLNKRAQPQRPGDEPGRGPDAARGHPGERGLAGALGRRAWPAGSPGRHLHPDVGRLRRTGRDGARRGGEPDRRPCRHGLGLGVLASRRADLAHPRAGRIAHTNIAFGGPERKTLYITESETGSILTAKLDVPGKPMYSHA